MTVTTGQAGGDETPNVVETLVNELVDVRDQLSTALGDLYEQGEDLVKARNEIAYRDRKITELTADLDRARDVAVALEQEASVYGATSRAFGDDPDGEHDEDDPTIGRQPAGELDRIFARWQNPDPNPIVLPPSVVARAAEIAAEVEWPDTARRPFSEQVLDIGRQELAERETLTVSLDNTTGRFTPDPPPWSQIGSYDSSGELHPFEGTEEACARCGLVRAAPYHRPRYLGNPTGFRLDTDG